jgi:para-nitrobenzyl esterase
VQQARRSAQDLAGDRFIGYSTWKWLEMQLKTGKAPVFRYRFEETLPLATDAPAGAEATAPHRYGSVDRYALGGIGVCQRG